MEINGSNANGFAHYHITSSLPSYYCIVYAGGCGYQPFHTTYCLASTIVTAFSLSSSAGGLQNRRYECGVSRVYQAVAGWHTAEIHNVMAVFPRAPTRTIGAHTRV